MRRTAEGYIEINNKEYLYSYAEGMLSIMANTIDVSRGKIQEQQFLANEWGHLTAEQTLFHTLLPVQFLGMPGVYHSEVDWYIVHYKSDTTYSEMEFTFPELQYFVRSFGNIQENETSYVIQKRPEMIDSFSFLLKNVTVTAFIETRVEPFFSINGSIIKTVSYLRFRFPETKDLQFLRSLYNLVDNIFAFLCNRKNVAIGYATIRGKVASPRINHQDGDLVEFPSTQELHMFNKYREPQESDKTISETISYEMVKSHFKELFDFAALNYSENGKSLSTNSIHASDKARHLIDFRHTLQVVAAFEFYQREFLPEVSSDDTLEAYEDIKKCLDDYIDNHTGKNKTVAKDIKKHLRPDSALKDKLQKAYYGYKGWESLEEILSCDVGNSVPRLTEIANRFRNDMAHEKRSFDPDNNTINAVNLVEHINYCIVLRQVGYSDDEIKSIIHTILLPVM